MSHHAHGTQRADKIGALSLATPSTVIAWERGCGRRDVKLRGEVSGSRFIDESIAPKSLAKKLCRNARYASESNA